MKFAIIAILGMFASALASRNNCGNKNCVGEQRCCKNPQSKETTCQLNPCTDNAPAGTWKRVKINKARRRF